MRRKRACAFQMFPFLLTLSRECSFPQIKPQMSHYSFFSKPNFSASLSKVDKKFDISCSWGLKSHRCPERGLSVPIQPSMFSPSRTLKLVRCGTPSGVSHHGHLCICLPRTLWMGCVLVRGAEVVHGYHGNH